MYLEKNWSWNYLQVFVHFSTPWFLHTVGRPQHLFRLWGTLKYHYIHSLCFVCVLDLKKENEDEMIVWHLWRFITLLSENSRVKNYLAIRIQFSKFYVIDKRDVILRVPIKTVIKSIKRHQVDHSIDWLYYLKVKMIRFELIFETVI